MQRIEGLTIELDLETVKVNSGLEDLNRKMKLVNSEMRTNMSAFDRSEKSVHKYETRLHGLNRKLEVQKTVVDKAQKSYEKMVKEHGEGSEEAEKAAIEYNKQAASLQNLERYVERTTEELAQFKEEQRIANSNWTKFGENLEIAGSKMKTFGENMTNFGKDYTMKVTTPIVAGGAAVFKASMDYESAFAGVAKTFSGTEEQLADLRVGIREMAKEIPASTTEIAAVAEAAGQLGIEAESIEEFTRTMIDLGEATNMTSETAATEFARFANITQMSQKDFDRMGSSIVALGNSMATTESEISSMAMRLAAQGSQVGMTEAQILALAGTMSSLGIEAEAGGTAMTMVLKKMQTAVADNGAELEIWAETANMSVTDFKKAFEEDAITALDALIKGLAESGSEGENLTSILEDLGIKGIRESDTMLRLAGASDLLADAVNTSSTAWEENTALAEEAEQRYATTESKLKILWNRVKDMAIVTGDALVPVIMDLLDHAEPLIKRIEEGAQAFSDMSDEEQKTILKTIALVAAIGPASIGIGKMSTGIGGLLTLTGRLSKSIGKSGGAGKGAGLIGSIGTMGVAGGPVALATLAIGGLTAGAMALHNHLKKDVIPEVELFGDEISESTKQGLDSFLELNDEATAQLNELSWSGKVVSEEMAEQLAGTFDAMGQQIVDGLKQRKDESLTSIQEMFVNAKDISETEQEEILKSASESYDERIRITQEGVNRINEINRTAASENRVKTSEEEAEILQIKNDMLNTAIEVMSENEQEQRFILDRMHEQADAITKQQAIDTIKNSAEAREGVIKEAEENFFNQKSTYEMMRDVTGELSAEQADKMIDEARRQRDETIKEAEGMHQGVLEKAIEYHPEILTEVSSLTGEIYNGYEKLASKTVNLFIDMYKDIKDQTVSTVSDVARSINGMKILKDVDWKGLASKTVARGVRSALGYAEGTPPTGHPGGLAVVGDGGGSELIITPKGKTFLSPPTDTLLDLEMGSHVIPHRETNKLLKLLPKYADGTTGWRSEFSTLVALMGRGTTSSDNTSSGGTSDDSLIKELLNATLQQNELLMQLVAKESNTYLDGQQLTNTIAPRMSKKLNELNKAGARQNGVIIT